MRMGSDLDSGERRRMALSKTNTTLMWGLSILLAALFVFAGAGKVIGLPEMAEGFRGYGYPDWFRVLVGVIEVVCGVGLLIPKVAIDAASFLVIVMVGAVVTELLVGESVFPPLIALLLVGGTAALRGDE
jgi:uncharacterized membrane protein YphA (DoxX/SURF4 family)